MLHYFDGQCPRSALRTVAQQTNVELDVDLVRLLLDFELLLPDSD